MKNIVAVSLCLFSLLLGPVFALADEVADIRASIQSVRENLVVLLVTTDEQKQMKRREEIRLLTQGIDTQLSLLQRRQIPEELAERLTEFKLIWGEFKTTRDQEIIPRLLSGEKVKVKEAKVIARTIQAERFQKMQSLLK